MHAQHMNNLASSSAIHDSAASLVDPKRADQPVDTIHVQRRTTINQSLSTATIAAKKWLTARQNTNTSGAAAGSHAAGNGGNGQAAAIHLREPIGRGQPLPPPGKSTDHYKYTFPFDERKHLLRKKIPGTRV